MRHLEVKREGARADDDNVRQVACALAGQHARCRIEIRSECWVMYREILILTIQHAEHSIYTLLQSDADYLLP